MAGVLRIWFNRTYATAHQVIGMLRANPQQRPVHVVGTHVDPDSPVLVACDEAFPEPESGADEYVAWALDFARTHRVDVLVPRLHMAALADARTEFEVRGTRLLCAEASTVRLLADKDAAYVAAASLGVPVPPYRVVRDAAALRSAFEEFAALAEHVVMKPPVASGGAGYRRLTDRRPTVADLDGTSGSLVHVEDVCAAFDAAVVAGEPVPPRMIMPYLPGPEISLDVLARADGEVLAAVGRSRSRRRRLIVDDAPACEVAGVLTPALRIGYLSNTQVRYWQAPADGAPRPYLLEVNTRISGGLFQTALAGVNLPWAAVRLALGEDAGPLRPRFGAAFAALAGLVELPSSRRW